MDFYYPNFTNDMWRIFGYLFEGDKLRFVKREEKTFDLEKIVSLLLEKGIAIFDTATEVRRLKDNASDKYLEVVTPTPLDEMVKELPELLAIVTTGQKATETLAAYFGIALPKMGEYTEFEHEGRRLRLYRMPSSSRAYPMKVEKKAEMYRGMFEDVGML